ncbi:MAG: hypothetical protein H6748_10345 [Spirochaetaceae bacterium]|nr:hypothetical protein [Myxococcales bacterium]MCB9724431.1 hypothetical protein [Spirochaetaceae bacterium]HPG24302.1 ATP-binding protein [Myxococcota bacterium]
MAGQGSRESPGAGPGNKAIATTLLEMLAARGREAAVERARRALESGDGSTLAEAGPWIESERLIACLGAAGIDAGFARSLGHRVVGPDAAGLRLYGLGLATPEKAFRRIQALLPREDPDGRWKIDEIHGGRARLRFRSADAKRTDRARRSGSREAECEVPDGAGHRHTIAHPPRVERTLCALRVGMLEALPGLYGLLPARVRETACRASGAEACAYEVVWQRDARTGVVAGTIVGVVLAAIVVTVARVAPELMAPIAAPVGGVFAAVAAAAFGRMVDLRRQLEAVAGARRGHLALFDQVDETLAEKLDALARVEARVEAGAAPDARRRSVGAGLDRSGGSEPDVVRGDDAVCSTALEIHAAAGDLECWLDARAGHAAVEGGADEEDARALVRDLREAAARLVRSGDTVLRRSTHLDTLIHRAVASARPLLDARAEVVVEVDAALPRIACDPLEIERLVVQLLRNAVEASRNLGDRAQVRIRLRRAPRGLELAVLDRGVGIDSGEVDEVFDPFFGEAAGGRRGRSGLADCLSIVEGHGGELTIAAEAGGGTRVTVLLPGDGAPWPATTDEGDGAAASAGSAS